MGGKVLITGITGFLGSDIAAEFLSEGWEVIGLKRQNSKLWRCDEFVDKITLIDIDSSKDYKCEIINNRPEIIVHCAWGGVAAGDRIQYKSQVENLELLIDILEIAKEIKISKFIGLGSQAEYGTFSGKINEEYPSEPTTAYGVAKLMALNLVKGFCNENGINWYWLRLFPIFGEKEEENWLIPSVIKKIKQGIQMDLTPGLQRYSYIYVKDLSNCIYNIVSIELSSSTSGIYNISGEGAITLRDLVEKIKNKININARLNFGALAYRPYQSMHMEGDMRKFNENISKISYSNFDESLNKTILYYLKK